MTKVAKPKLNCHTCKDTGIVTEWHQLLEFNPNSSDQVLSLMHHFKLKIPKKRGEDRETTEAKYLKRFGKKLPVFKGILDVRQRAKLISNYIWQTQIAYLGEAAYDSVRTTLGHNPSTWRKSSKAPNLQIIPIRGPLAPAVRATVRAPKDYVLVEADSEGIEAVLVAYDAGDPLLMKVCKAGPHGFFMASTQGRAIDPKLPFLALKKLCKAEKKRDPALYDTHKRCIHGTHYGLTPYGMADEYEEEFLPRPERGDREKSALAVATRFQNAYLNLWPPLAGWMRRIRQQAYEQRYLDNHFDYRHYFYDVMHWDVKRRDYVLGEDGKRCIAFKPQSDGSAIQTEYILEIQDRADAGDERYQLLANCFSLPIHDSLLFLVPRSEVDWVPQAIADVMNRPFDELGGLRIGVEVKVGENLRDTEVAKIQQIEWHEGEEQHAVAST